MNQKISQQNWSSVKGEIQKSFTNLSADELEETHGDPSLLTDLLAEKAGLRRAEAEKRLDEIIARRSTSQATSFYDEDDFEDYVDVDVDDERFGADEGLTSPSSHKEAAPRSAERTPRQDFKSEETTDKSSGRIVSSDRSEKINRSSSEYPTERRSPDTNPSSNPKKTDRSI